MCDVVIVIVGMLGYGGQVSLGVVSLPRPLFARLRFRCRLRLPGGPCVTGLGLFEMNWRRAGWKR